MYFSLGVGILVVTVCILVILSTLFTDVSIVFGIFSPIDRTRQTILEEKYRNVFRQMTVTYIFGPTGTGKTRSVKEGCGYSNCYAVSDYHHPFDGYRGQKVMLFDEFHSSLPLNSMLQYLDGYPLELPCRYANKQAC